MLIIGGIMKKKIIEIILVVIDLDKNILWVCKSITCLACASQNNKIISLDNFIKLTC